MTIHHRTLLLTLATLAFTACASMPASQPAIQWANSADFDLEVRDNPAQRRFDLTLSASGTRALCMTLEQWPNKTGQLSAEAEIRTSQANFPAQTVEYGYCPGGCGQHRIEPGKQLEGFIAYSDFGDADAIARDSHRELVFQAHPYYCASKQN